MLKNHKKMTKTYKIYVFLDSLSQYLVKYMMQEHQIYNDFDADLFA